MDAGTKCMVCKTGIAEEGRKVCPECLGSKRKVSSASGPKVLSEIVDGTKRAMEAKRLTKTAGVGGMRYQCNRHGEHNGCTFGGKHSAECPACLEVKKAAIRQLKRAWPDGLILDFRKAKELLARIESSAASSYRTAEQQAMFFISKGIEGDQGGKQRRD